MRVAIFHPEFRLVGGAELLLIKNAESLREHGFDVSFVTFALKGAFWEAFARAWPVKVVAKREGLEYLYALTRSAKVACRQRRAEPFLADFDLVQAINHPCSTMLGRMAVPGRRYWWCMEAPRSLFPRETSPFGMAALERLGPVNPALAALQAQSRRLGSFLDGHARARKESQAAVPRLDHTIFISRFTMANARAAYGPLPGTVIPPIISFPPPMAPRPAPDRQALKVLVQTRFTPLKNVETILEGFLQFQAQHPRAELHLAGAGPSLPGYQARLAQAPGGGQVHLHGFVSDSDLASLRQACDVYALLPLDEPFGMVYPEAAAQGLLMVGSNHGGPAEIMEDGRLGWLCDPFAPEAFRDALEQILATSDADLRERRHQADASCRARFSAGVVGPQLAAALRG